MAKAVVKAASWKIKSLTSLPLSSHNYKFCAPHLIPPLKYSHSNNPKEKAKERIKETLIPNGNGSHHMRSKSTFHPTLHSTRKWYETEIHS
jgi:hypothetical protein